LKEYGLLDKLISSYTFLSNDAEKSWKKAEKCVLKINFAKTKEYSSDDINYYKK
jgi:hypothetical protein